MTQLYLKWSINAEVLQYPMEFYKTPAITFCFIMYSAFKEKCDSVENCQKYMTNSRAYFENTVQFEDVMDIIMYVDAEVHPTQLISREEIQAFARRTTSRYKVDLHTCYHVDFNIALNGSLHSQRTLRNLRFPWIIGFLLNENFRNLTNTDSLVFLTESGKLPDSIILASPEGFEKDRTLLVEYKRTELNLLEPPYTTNCRDYSKSGFKSQVDCLQRCSAKESITQQGGLPHHIPIVEGVNEPFAPYQAKNFDVFSKECDRQCKQNDCRLEFYESQLSIAVEQSNMDWTVYSLRLPRVPDVIINYEPLMLFAEYLAMMASILGLWLGLSVYSMFDMLKSVVAIRSRVRKR